MTRLVVLQGRSGVSTFRDAGKRAHLYGGNHLMFGKIQQLIAALKAWSATQPRPKQRAVDNALSKLLKYWDGKGKEMVTVPTMGDGVALKKSFTYSERRRPRSYLTSCAPTPKNRPLMFSRNP